MHAFGGCDTTSAIFGHRKGSIYTLLNSSAQLQHHCITLQTEAATHDEVTTAGLKLMEAIFGGSENDSLAGLRYSSYCTMSLGRRFQTERLPPSNDATRLHSMRAHLQAVIWTKLNTTDIAPAMFTF